MKNYTVKFEEIDYERIGYIQEILSITRELSANDLVHIFVGRDGNNYYFRFNFTESSDWNYVFYDAEERIIYVWCDGQKYLQGVVLNDDIDEDVIEFTFYFGYNNLIAISLTTE